jgi:hypothetical protein
MKRIRDLEWQIAQIQADEPKLPLNAIDTFFNKQFNQVRSKMPHLKSGEIKQIIQSRWHHSITPRERQELEQEA